MPLWSSVRKVVEKFIIKPIIQKGVDFMVTKIQTMLLALLGSISGAEDLVGIPDSRYNDSMRYLPRDIWGFNSPLCKLFLLNSNFIIINNNNDNTNNICKWMYFFMINGINMGR